MQVLIENHTCISNMNDQLKNLQRRIDFNIIKALLLNSIIKLELRRKPFKKQ